MGSKVFVEFAEDSNRPKWSKTLTCTLDSDGDYMWYSDNTTPPGHKIAAVVTDRVHPLFLAVAKLLVEASPNSYRVNSAVEVEQTLTGRDKSRKYIPPSKFKWRDR